MQTDSQTATRACVARATNSDLDSSRAHRRDIEDADAQAPSLLDALSPSELGRVGELIAAAYLEERGYEIVERRFRCREGEADLIARDLVEDALVMVEVKTRRRGSANEELYPEEAVDTRKQQRYRRIAARYLSERASDEAVRFDVVAITVSPGSVADVMHVSDAFDWKLGR